MSSRKSKLDLLVKVRYQNPLPAPPCPPKLIDIPTNPQRYARPEFIDLLANDAPLPMIVDAECGMPLDLSKWEALWADPASADDFALNPSPSHMPELDSADQALLFDPSAPTTSTEFIRSSARLPNPSAPLPAHVTWLRKTEYLSRDAASPARASPSESQKTDERPDVSPAAQLRSIEASFANAAAFEDVSTLQHPTKRGVTAVASYEVLPDVSIWPNAYDLFRFSERPGERGPETDDPRLDCAVMRPMESDGEHFLAYYLTKEDEDAMRSKQVRTAGDIDLLQDEDEATEFHFVRDYEVVRVESEVPNEFLLVLDDGDTGVPDRGQGAYYKPIERKMLLKKKRTEPIERFRDKWSLVRVAHAPPPPDEADERADALAEVTDPEYFFRGADAEGEPDHAAHANGHEVLNGNGDSNGVNGYDEDVSMSIEVGA
ncbi:RNA polymerase II-associated [Amylostereum chailletii]|nr:RNA polymerase II-associated [Amylostereum chailletii]